MVVGVAAPHTPLRLHKKQVTSEDKMNSVVTYNNIRLKCYIKVYAPYCIVRDVIGCSPILANAIDYFYQFILEKKEKFYNFNFLIHTLFSSSITQTILSPFDNPSLSTTSFGIVVRRLFDVVSALFVFVIIFTIISSYLYRLFFC